MQSLVKFNTHKNIIRRAHDCWIRLVFASCRSVTIQKAPPDEMAGEGHHLQHVWYYMYITWYYMQYITWYYIILVFVSNFWQITTTSKVNVGLGLQQLSPAVLGEWPREGDHGYRCPEGASVIGCLDNPAQSDSDISWTCSMWHGNDVEHLWGAGGHSSCPAGTR